MTDTAKKTPAKKAPAKKAPAKTAPAAETTPDVVAPAGKQYVALKAMTVGEKNYKPGDVVPEASNWLRVDSWVRARYIEEA